MLMILVSFCHTYSFSTFKNYNTRISLKNIKIAKKVKTTHFTSNMNRIIFVSLKHPMHVNACYALVKWFPVFRVWEFGPQGSNWNIMGLLSGGGGLTGGLCRRALGNLGYLTSSPFPALACWLLLCVVLPHHVLFPRVLHCHRTSALVSTGLWAEPANQKWKETLFLMSSWSQVFCHSDRELTQHYQWLQHHLKASICL